jgi:predicted ferric reductase
VIRSALGVLLAFGLTAPGLVFLASTGDLGLYFREPVPPGQFLYVLAKVTGLYAITLIWVQLMLGALRPWLEAAFSPGALARLHLRLGPLALLLVLAHALLFASAVSLRSQGHFPWTLFVPQLTGPYYPRRVSLGVMALFLLFTAAAGAALRRRRGFRAVWRKLHVLNYAVFALALLHSFSIGSETRTEPLTALYAGMALSAGVAPLAAARLRWRRWARA